MDHGESVRFVRARRDHLRQMMAWFPDASSCALWGGPDFRFPFTEETFVADSRCGTLPTYSLVSESGTLLGFGQYYDRIGRCHLSRLAIAPDQRGRGLGARLIEGLIELGAPALHASECSLFVARTNPAARRLYERLGFTVAPYPEASFTVAGTDYMIAACAMVLSRARGGQPGPKIGSEPNILE
jgi:ribosomal protein S18 acetylase RimI-like enzyme